MTDEWKKAYAVASQKSLALLEQFDMGMLDAEAAAASCADQGGIAAWQFGWFLGFYAGVGAMVINLESGDEEI